MGKLPGRPDLPAVEYMRSRLKKLYEYKGTDNPLARMSDDSVAVDYRYLEIAGYLPKDE